MKKVILLFLCLLALNAGVHADTDRPIHLGQLPTKAQAFITAYFKNNRVALAKMENGIFYKTYDVIFTNGSKLEFDRSGDWTEIKCRTADVPFQAMPAPIRSYLKENYPEARVKEIERDAKGYEVKLSTGLEITFDRQFRVTDIDD